jgi:hypothetical protein
MPSYQETLTLKKLIKMGFFIIKIYYISSSNDLNITYTKNHIFYLGKIRRKFMADQGMLQPESIFVK